MTKCFEIYPACAELVLHIVLNMPDLVIVEMHTQEFIENSAGRSVRLNVRSADSEGRKFDIGVQRLDAGADSGWIKTYWGIVNVGIFDEETKFIESPNFDDLTDMRKRGSVF